VRLHERIYGVQPVVLDQYGEEILAKLFRRLLILLLNLVKIKAFDGKITFLKCHPIKKHLNTLEAICVAEFQRLSLYILW
jgi:hypothetical protein